MIFASYPLIRPFPRTFGSEVDQGNFNSMANLEFLTTPRTNTNSFILQIGFTEQVKMKNCKHSLYNFSMQMNPQTSMRAMTRNLSTDLMLPLPRRRRVPAPRASCRLQALCRSSTGAAPTTLQISCTQPTENRSLSKQRDTYYRDAAYSVQINGQNDKSKGTFDTSLIDTIYIFHKNMMDILCRPYFYQYLGGFMP